MVVGGIDKNIKSYVPASVNMSMAKEKSSPTWRSAIEQIRELGPATRDELRYTDLTGLREYGVYPLCLKTAAPTVGYGQQTSVYYLPDEQSKEQVVRKYIEANPKIVDGKSKRQLVVLFRKAGPEFKQAAQNVADEFELATHSDTGGYNTVTRNCPYCGATVDRMANHIRHHCSEV